MTQVFFNSRFLHLRFAWYYLYHPLRGEIKSAHEPPKRRGFDPAKIAWLGAELPEGAKAKGRRRMRGKLRKAKGDVLERGNMIRLCPIFFGLTVGFITIPRCEMQESEMWSILDTRALKRASHQTKNTYPWSKYHALSPSSSKASAQSCSP